jgi:RecA/RadA recombinase
MKVGLVFGDPRTLPGGKALEFSTTQQAEVKNKEHLGKDDDQNEVVLYNEHNVKITKNKGGGPMKEAAFKLIRLNGFEGLPEAWVDQAKTLYKYGTQTGVITGGPTGFEVDGVTGKFKSAAHFNTWAMENPILYGTTQQKIIDGFRKRWDLD